MTVVVDSEAELGGHVECLVVADCSRLIGSFDPAPGPPSPSRSPGSHRRECRAELVERIRYMLV
jgi:hypothetical protein